MIGSLANALLGRTPRERWLIGLMLVVALPLGAVFAVILPLAEQGTAARASAAEARALRDWVSHRAAEAAQLAPLPEAEVTGPEAPIGISDLDLSLREAGLRDAVATLSNRGGGEVELGFDAVRFTEFMLWVDGMSGGWGYDISTLRLDRSDEGDIVSARLVLRPAE